MKHRFYLLLILLAATLGVQAKDYVSRDGGHMLRGFGQERYSLSLMAEYGYNRSWEHMGNVDVYAHMPVVQNVQLDARLQYQSANVLTGAVVVRPTFDLPVGQLFLETELLYKAVMLVTLAVHWFNPLVWLAYILLCKDIELACDEKVIKKIGYDKKKDYSQTLLNLSIPRKYISACPVAFGEVGINERIKNVLTMKKGKKIIIAVAVAICAVLAICFLTYPKKIKNNSGDVAEVQASEETAEEIEEATTEETTTETNSSENVVECFPVIGSGTITRQFSEDHQSVDIAAEEGTAIVSVYDGTVEEVGSNEEEGYYIIIKNEKGCTVKYSHLKDEPNVSKGDKVNADEEVGKVGSTGNSTGPHVHIELTDENGTLIDPMIIIEDK